MIAPALQKIVAICILAEIAHDSYQIKHAVTFVRPSVPSLPFQLSGLTRDSARSQPNAPGGTSEGLLGYVIRELDFEGRHGLTFGASATEDLEVEHNLGGWKIKLLGKAYRKIVAKYELANRGQFRVSPCFIQLTSRKHRVLRPQEWPGSTRSKSSELKTNHCTSPTVRARSAGPAWSPS